MHLSLQSSDRLLCIAPHPDDESIAMGGLLQRAVQAGAAVKVLLVTNGDNNPWPQRWVEKRFRIGPEERQRWGALRRQEARTALKKLGLHGDAEFLQFPDQGMTSRLLQADRETLERFCRAIEEWNPTHLVLPSGYDLHPDHNALYVLLQLALERTGRTDISQLQFLVHCKRPDLVPRRMTLELSEHERQVKRQAIFCHATQMALSSKRFLAYARLQEHFYAPGPLEAALPQHRVCEAFLHRGALNLTVELPARRGKRSAILVAGESPHAGSVRWRLPLPASSRKVRLIDTVTQEMGREATVRITGRVASIKIPVAAVAPFTRLFVKLHHRAIFLDEAGWRPA